MSVFPLMEAVEKTGRLLSSFFYVGFFAVNIFNSLKQKSRKQLFMAPAGSGIKC